LLPTKSTNHTKEPLFFYTHTCAQRKLLEQFIETLKYGIFVLSWSPCKETYPPDLVVSIALGQNFRVKSVSVREKNISAQKNTQ